jgi:hypothetical protein
VIFILKHRWYWSLPVTAAVALAVWALGGWEQLTGGPAALGVQVLLGVAGGGLALAVDGTVHEIFLRLEGTSYRRELFRHAWRIAAPLRGREILLGGVMAAVAEEPLFRGLILGAFPSPAAGIAASALLFAACHWLPRGSWRFSAWAAWEGVFFGILLVASGSLLVPMIAHGIHDAAAYVALRRIVRREEARYEAAARPKALESEAPR